jgi:hypothetical protein
MAVIQHIYKNLSTRQKTQPRNSSATLKHKNGGVDLRGVDI